MCLRGVLTLGSKVYSSGGGGGVRARQHQGVHRRAAVGRYTYSNASTSLPSVVRARQCPERCERETESLSGTVHAVPRESLLGPRKSLARLHLRPDASALHLNPFSSGAQCTRQHWECFPPPPLPHHINLLSLLLLFLLPPPFFFFFLFSSSSSSSSSSFAMSLSSRLSPSPSHTRPLPHPRTYTAT